MIHAYNNEILIVIVLYKQSILNSNAYKSLNKQSSNYPIFFYNNSPQDNIENRKYLKSKDIYIHDPLNHGLSYAYNQAAKYALDNAYTWLLLLDQDTTLPDIFLDTYQKLINKYPFINLFAPSVRIKGTNCFSSPGIKKLKRVVSKGKKYSGILSLKTYGAINSGLLINVRSYLQCGGYNEKVYLDFSDFQFLERFSKYNNVFMASDIEVEQCFSNNETNPEILMNRFMIYSYCARNCRMETIFDIFSYFIVVLGRSTKLFLRTRKLSFYKIMIRNFILGHHP
jgi:GT2 family glycosyltransferase